ncbi:hypothetical protein H4219_000230 [Mycoemilia scoparia]|uniref:Uncharacterized protein n=1 Tax=Mycoemilia scoparia TaxID=417184 RepID=A0A9W8A346_9FUNG|nr:hypothetical protein H4219_000230 [Mycoemilia scoparia]
MINIYQRFISRIESDEISVKDLWNRLETWYNMEMLNEQELEDDEEEEAIKKQHIPIIERCISEGMLFSDDVVGTNPTNFWKKSVYEFNLPWQEFGEMMMERAGAQGDEDGTESVSAIADAASTISSVKAESPAPEIEPVTPAPKKRKVRPAASASKSRSKTPKAPASTRKRSKARN